MRSGKALKSCPGTCVFRTEASIDMTKPTGHLFSIPYPQQYCVHLPYKCQGTAFSRAVKRKKKSFRTAVPRSWAASPYFLFALQLLQHLHAIFIVRVQL